MTSENSRFVRLLVRIGRALRDAGRAQEELWTRLERIDPRPGDDLHWEPTVSGWRLVGEHLPELREPTT